jgi:hypothetical protein
MFRDVEGYVVDSFAAQREYFSRSARMNFLHKETRFGQDGFAAPEGGFALRE